MKRVLIPLMILWSSGNVDIICQNVKNNRLDPRHFVTIRELNRQNNKSITILESESSDALKLDINSLISVEFDHQSMSDNSEYYGNVSIIAKINNEPVKVSPYSKVGEKQGKIGLNSASPAEISSRCINLLNSMEDLSKNLSSWMDKKFYVSLDSVNSGSLDYGIAYFDKKNSQDTAKYNTLPETIQWIIEQYDRCSPTLLLLTTPGCYVTMKDMGNGLRSLKADLKNEKFIKYLKEQEILEYKKIAQKLDLARSYLIFFQAGNEDVRELFLLLTKQDRIAVDDIAQQLETCSLEIHVLDTLNEGIKMKNLDPKLILLKNSVETFTIRTRNALKVFNIEIPLYDASYLASKTSSVNYDTIYAPPDTISKRKAMISKNNDISKQEKAAKRNLASEIGKLVYQKLFTGYIDLRELRAKEGDVLKISLLWYRNSDSTQAPLELELAAYEIKEIGWRLKVADSFLLVNRQTVPKNDEFISPSRFKGAPGASLLFSYGSSDKKSIIHLEPSLGLNISYLDFDTGKDLEVGVGFVLGLLRNRIFLTYGYNLHAENKREYYGVGFSFTNIAKPDNK